MWEWLKDLINFSPAEDTHPDPEDPTAYAHVALVEQEFKDAGEAFQVLPGGKQPTDVSKRSKLTSPSGFSYWVDVYDGPKGKGYVIRYETTRAGKLVRKAVNFGPETWREQDWEEVKDVRRG